MRVFILLLVMVGLVLTGCQVVQGSGNVVAEERQVDEFDGVSLSGIGEVTFIQANEQSVLIEAEDNIISYITTDVRNNVLFIGIKDGVSIQNKKPLKFTISAPEINLLDVSGAGKIVSEEIDSHDLSIDVSGSGDVAIGDVKTDSLDVRISGSGKVMAQGKADAQQVKITGSGSYAAPDLVSDKVDVDVSGSGEALVWANDTLRVDISGAGKVAFQGEPQVDSSISGAGVVQQIAGR